MFDITEQDNAPMYSVIWNNNGVKTQSEGTVDVLFENGVPEVDIIYTVKKDALAEIKKLHGAALFKLTVEVTPEERDTWPVKQALYQKLQDDTLTDDERSYVEQALIEGETVESYLTLVNRKANAFMELAFFAEGFKRKTNAAIRAADSVEAIEIVMNSAANEKKAAEAAFEAKLAAA